MGRCIYGFLTLGRWMPLVELLEIDARRARVDLEGVTLNDLMGVSWHFVDNYRSVDSSWVVFALKSDKTQEIGAAHKKKLWQLHLSSEWVTKDSIQCQQCVISDPNLFCHRRHTFALAKLLGRSRVNVKVHQSLLQSQDILSQLLLSCLHMALNYACALLDFYPHV